MKGRRTKVSRSNSQTPFWGLDCCPFGPYFVPMERKGTKIYFDFEIWHWLKAESKRKRISVSALVRLFVLEKMEQSK